MNDSLNENQPGYFAEETLTSSTGPKSLEMKIAVHGPADERLAAIEKVATELAAHHAESAAAERDRALEYLDDRGAPEGLDAGIKWLEAKWAEYSSKCDRLQTQLMFANKGYEDQRAKRLEADRQLDAATERAEKAEATLAAVRRHVEERRGMLRQAAGSLPDEPTTDGAAINGGLTELGHIVTVLDSGGAALPRWHDKPTGPGRWYCVYDGKAGRYVQSSVIDLDQAALDEGAPFYTARVYGPIPADAGR